jgi:hypothetical protein
MRTIRMIKLDAEVDLINKAEEMSRIKRKAAPLNMKTQKLGTFKK